MGFHEPLSVIDGVGCGSPAVIAAVEEYHDGLVPLLSGSGPHVQGQAILSAGIVRARFGRPVRLDRGLAVITCLINTFIRIRLHRRLPPQIAYRRFCVRNAFEGQDAVFLTSHKGPVFTPDGFPFIEIPGDRYVFPVFLFHHPDPVLFCISAAAQDQPYQQNDQQYCKTLFH